MKKVPQTIAFVVLATLALVSALLGLGVLGLLAIPLLVRSRLAHRNWLRCLRSSERIVTPTKVTSHRVSGTLIVDQPDWGGTKKYCWWTPDDIAALSPVETTPLSDRIETLNWKIDRDGLPFDLWFYRKYLHANDGLASLVTTDRGDLVASRLQATKVGLQVIETWSGVVAEFLEA